MNLPAKRETVYLKDYQPIDFIVESVHLHLDLHDHCAEVKAILDLKRNPSSAAGPLVLDGEEMQLNAVHLDGRLLDSDEYEVTDSTLTIKQVPDHFKLETYVTIKPQENKSLSGLYQSRTNFCTQCEAQGFRRITYFFDRPDVMTRFTTTITAEKSKYPVLLSNGNLIEEKQLSEHRHWVRWEDPSLKPCYLFALVAGDFDILRDSFTTMSGRDIELVLYLEKGFLDQGDFALQALKRSMKWDEEQYGREYDLDIYMIVAVSDFNMGAMENKGLNVFNTKYVLAKPQTATDQDYIGIEAVIGHEYFHNWTGNRITCRDWFQLTLKEGLTVFRDQTFTEDMTSAVSRLDVVNVVRNHQFPEDAGPNAHPIRPQSYMEINNFYTMTVYRKGAEVIRMIRTLIGKDNFRKAMDIYFERHDGQAVTTEDFIKTMEDASGRDLTQFKRWYDQAGTPVLTVSSDYNVQAKTYTLTVKQETPATPGQDKKLPFHLPLVIGLISSEGEDMETQLEGEAKPVAGSRILDLTETEQSFIFVNVTESPVPSLLRGFSAPVQLHYDYSDEELLWLLQCDSDAFSRYEAGQQYMRRLICRVADDYQAGRDFEEDHALIDAFKVVLKDAHQDPQYVARLLTLPAFEYLMQQDDVRDIEALAQARQLVKKSLAISLSEQWLECYGANKLCHYQFTMSDVGARALKNIALNYLTATEDAQFYQLAYQQFTSADNMTDSMGALQALNNYHCDERTNALSDFYHKWQDQPLVVNKWFLLQATSLIPTTLDAVKALTEHEAFDIANPNNVYALICGFAANKPLFHDKSGEGYRFIADQVIRIDPMNPQVAAKLVLPLTRWRQFDEKRQPLMKQELVRILQVDNLSSDVFELVSKSIN